MPTFAQNSAYALLNAPYRQASPRYADIRPKFCIHCGVDVPVITGNSSIDLRRGNTSWQRSSECPSSGYQSFHLPVPLGLARTQVFSAPGTPETGEDPVISAPGTLETSEDSAIPAPGTRRTSEDPVMSAPYTVGTSE